MNVDFVRGRWISWISLFRQTVLICSRNSKRVPGRHGSVSVFCIGFWFFGRFLKSIRFSVSVFLNIGYRFGFSVFLLCKLKRR